MKHIDRIFAANTKVIIIKLILFCILLTAFSAQAQFFSKSHSSKKRNKNVPTVITADSMDFDISKNVAVFTGNVHVDDSEMTIYCHKMIINFEGDTKDSKSNKKVKDIICLKNVVIIRKLEKGDKKGGTQKATSGKAVYDVQAGKITLTINPALQRGPDTLRGAVIVFWTDSERLSVHKSTELKIRSNPNND